MPRAAFTTLGCKVNQYETQRILEDFENAGFEVVPFSDSADVYVINTCSVTSSAESKSRYTIRRAIRSNPDAKVMVTGCAAQMAINKSEALEGADIVVPNPAKLETLSYLYRSYPEFENWARSEPAAKKTEIVGRTRATLKIQDGCSVFCSYCSIPYTRPGLVSRPACEVLDEALKLAELGYRELILTGVLIGAYGPESGSGGPDFEMLTEQLALVPGIERIRISSIEMRQVTPRLFDLLKSKQVVPHLHIPLQSGSTKVLSDMNRPYTKDDYLDLCDRLYAEVPQMSITADIMVGFPTEGESEFLDSLDVAQKARYLKAHVFRFSPRHGTPADQWGDPVPDSEKQSRSARLTAMANETAAVHRRRFLGQTMRVIVEGKVSSSGLLEGLTDNYLEVKFAGSPSLKRQVVWVRLDEERDGVLFGELEAGPRAGKGAMGRMRAI